MEKKIRTTWVSNLLIFIYLIIVIPIIMWGFLNYNFMGYPGEVYQNIIMNKTKPLIHWLTLPFSVISGLGYAGGLFIVIILIFVGYLNIRKNWGRNTMVIGAWFNIFYLIGLSATALTVFLAEPHVLKEWFISEIIGLAVSYLFTVLILLQVKRIHPKQNQIFV